MKAAQAGVCSPDSTLVNLSAVFRVAALLACACTGVGAQTHASPTISTHSFTHGDGAVASYYSAEFGVAGASEVLVFAYGGSGCVSWREYMADYFDGLTGSITVFALNKRHVPDDAAGSDCGRAFARENHPRRWVADFTAFISQRVAAAARRPRRVVLLGVSEGAYVAARVARSRADVTDLVVIGDGAWTMRQCLTAQHGPGVVEAAWRSIAADANSLDRTWMGHPHRWWFDVMDLDATPDYLSLTVPILLGFGEKDESVPLASALALRDAFEQAGKRNLTIRVYAGADHTLVAGATNFRRQFFQELSRQLAR